MPHVKNLRSLTIYFGENEKDRIFEYGKQFFSTNNFSNQLKEYKIVVDSPLSETPQIKRLIQTAIVHFKDEKH